MAAENAAEMRQAAEAIIGGDVRELSARRLALTQHASGRDLEADNSKARNNG